MLLAQIDAESIAHTPLEDISLAAVSGEVVAALAPGVIAEGKSIALEDQGAPTVLGRGEAIAAALRNLVENAVRVTPAGGIISVCVGPGPTIGVRDGGSGLDPEELRRLIRRHCRADHASKTGAGLGLAIVDRIMAAHDGTLEAFAERQELRLRFE